MHHGPGRTARAPRRPARRARSQRRTPPRRAGEECLGRAGSRWCPKSYETRETLAIEAIWSSSLPTRPREQGRRLRHTQVVRAQPEETRPCPNGQVRARRPPHPPRPRHSVASAIRTCDTSMPSRFRASSTTCPARSLPTVPMYPASAPAWSAATATFTGLPPGNSGGELAVAVDDVVADAEDPDRPSTRHDPCTCGAESMLAYGGKVGGDACACGSECERAQERTVLRCDSREGEIARVKCDPSCPLTRSENRSARSAIGRASLSSRSTSRRRVVGHDLECTVEEFARRAPLRRASTASPAGNTWRGHRRRRSSAPQART